MTEQTQWTVTMADIYRHDPCPDGWAKLSKHTGLRATDDELTELARSIAAIFALKEQP